MTRVDAADDKTVKTFEAFPVTLNGTVLDGTTSVGGPLSEGSSRN